MGRISCDAYDNALGLRESETATAETFEAEFAIVTGRTVKLIESVGDPSDRVALIDGTETGVEFTAIHAGSADDIIAAVLRLARQKHDSYARRGVFDAQPMILLGHLDWPAKSVEGPALYDVWEQLTLLTTSGDFGGLGFSEIWLMDDGAKYTSRRDPRVPADFFCFAPAELAGFWCRERKRRPYWSLILDLLR
jgi:hypothetical protein